jgi:hypothetical protein
MQVEPFTTKLINGVHSHCHCIQMPAWQNFKRVGLHHFGNQCSERVGGNQHKKYCGLKFSAAPLNCFCHRAGFFHAESLSINEVLGSLAQQQESSIERLKPKE